MSLGVAGKGMLLEQKASWSLQGKKNQNRRKCLEAKYREVVQKSWDAENEDREKKSKKGEFAEEKMEVEEEKEKWSGKREVVFLL